jgi:prevent-host-death family protein
MAKLGLSQVVLSVESAEARLVNVHQAKTNLSQLLLDVEGGQEVVIARAGRPIARLVSWSPPQHHVAAPGAMRGQIDVADDFDEPLVELFDVLK